MTVLISYHHLTNHIVPGPQSLSYFVPLILLPLALLVPRSRLTRWQSISVFMPIITACTAHAWWAMGGVDVISVDVLLWSLFLLVLRDPWERFSWVERRGVAGRRDTVDHASEAPSGFSNPASERSIHCHEHDLTNGRHSTAMQHDKIEKEITSQPYPSDLSHRVPWVLTLLISIRLTNWQISSPSHDRHQPSPAAFQDRKSFALYGILGFVSAYLILDITTAFVMRDAYFTDTRVPISAPIPTIGLEGGMLAVFVRAMVTAAQPWAIISQMFYFPCLLPVALNAAGWLPDAWSPHNWPPYFSSVSTVFSHGVRGFWGQYWHQTMRWVAGGPGYALADAVDARKGSVTRYGLITIVAFFLSGVIHMGLVPPEPLNASIHVNGIRLRVAGFFWIQPMAMLVEVLVAKALRASADGHYWRSGHGRGIRALACTVWVLSWFTITMPLLAESFGQMGYWRVWPVPFSLWRGIRGEGWVTWSALQQFAG